MTYNKIIIDKQFPSIPDDCIKKQCKGVANFTAVNRPLILDDLKKINKPTIIRIRPRGQNSANHTIFYTGTKEDNELGKIYDSWAQTIADNGDIACRDYYDNSLIKLDINTNKHSVNKQYFTPCLRQSNNQGICALCALYHAIKFSKSKIKTTKNKEKLKNDFKSVLQANYEFKIEPQLEVTLY